MSTTLYVIDSCKTHIELRGKPEAVATHPQRPATPKIMAGKQQ